MAFLTRSGGLWFTEMLTNDIENTPSAAANGKTRLLKKMTATPVSVERKTLQTLQLDSTRSHLTRPGDQLRTIKNTRKEDKPRSKISPTHKPIQVFQDPEPQPKPSPSSQTSEDECSCHCHSKSDDDKMLDFMTQETSANDWRNVAEERRLALEESLIENRQLHFEVSELKTQLSDFKDEVTELKDENRRRSEQRDYFAGILQTLVNDDNNGSPSQKDSSSCSDSDVEGGRDDSSLSFSSP